MLDSPQIALQFFNRFLSNEIAALHREKVLSRYDQYMGHFAEQCLPHAPEGAQELMKYISKKWEGREQLQAKIEKAEALSNRGEESEERRQALVRARADARAIAGLEPETEAEAEFAIRQDLSLQDPASGLKRYSVRIIRQKDYPDQIFAIEKISNIAKEAGVWSIHISFEFGDMPNYYNFLAVTDDNEIVGFATVERKSSLVYVHLLDVHKHMRSTKASRCQEKVGTRLMLAIMDYARNVLNIKSVSLTAEVASHEEDSEEREKCERRSLFYLHFNQLGISTGYRDCGRDCEYNRDVCQRRRCDRHMLYDLSSGLNLQNAVAKIPQLHAHISQKKTWREIKR